MIGNSMDTLRIRGGIPLSGTVTVGGSKNAALPILAASLMANSRVVLKGIPDLLDVRHLPYLLQELGLQSRQSGGDLELALTDSRPSLSPR